MKRQEEIQRAHDIFRAIILQECPTPPLSGLPLTSYDMIIAMQDVLCWCLAHEHNQRFAANLNKVEKWLESKGYVLLRENPLGTI